ncbi:MAG: hypothetical protein NVSMB62_08130 [Acidobacteriaceae bacterium]
MSRWNLPLVAGAALLVAAPFAARYVPGTLSSTRQATSLADPIPPRPTSAAPKPPAVSEPNPESIGAQAKDELQKNICGFLEEYVGNPGKSPAEPYCPAVAAGEVKVLIAILPDPIHTHLALRFDRSIDDIQSALQRVGWTFDRAWLPWDNRGRAAPERFNDRLLDDSLQRARDNTPGALLFRRSRSEGEPLLVLVVCDTPTSGINPTQFRTAADIWKAFSEHNTPASPAAQTNRRSKLRSAQFDKHLAILGPTFSGSAESLKHLLEEELAPSRLPGSVRISISSGTLSDQTRLENLATAFPDDRAQRTVEPRSFNIDLLYSRLHLLDFLLKRGNPGKIMQLTEAESSFGSIGENGFQGTVLGAIEADQNELARLDCTDPGSMADCRDYEKDLRQQRHLLPLLKQLQTHYTDPETQGIGTLHFPREISRLRKAYEQSGIVGYTTADSGPRTELRFSFGADTRDDDTVPTFSGSQGDVAMETQMAQIASTLQSEHVTTVVLSATDVLDEIFVARYLAQHTPDLTVIIQDADQLFLRQASDSAMNEVYVVTPWPLLERNQRWSSPKDPQNPEYEQEPVSVPHASLSDQGIYNATQYLLCDHDFSNVSATPRDIPTPCRPETRNGHTNGLAFEEYEPPITLSEKSPLDLKEEPPLWLSVIERGQFTPVSLIDIDNEKQDLPDSSSFNLPRLFEVDRDAQHNEQNGGATHPRGIHEPTSLSVKLAATSVMLLLLLHGFACMLCSLHRPFAWSYALADRQQHLPRIILQAILPLLAIPTLSLFLIPPGLGLIVQSHEFELYLKVLQLLAVIVACIGPAMFFLSSAELPAWFPWLRPRPSLPITRRLWLHGWLSTCARIRCYRSLVVVCTTAAVGFFLMYVCHRLWWNWVAPSGDTPAERIFFLYRSASLLCGSSPAFTLLLLLAAIAFWVQRMFGRLVFFGHRIPRVPNGHTALRCPDQHWIKPLTNLLSDWKSPTRFALLIVSALSVLMMILLSEPRGPRSLAHGSFDRWVGFLTGAVATLIVHDLLMAGTIWTRLSELCLIPLKQSPLRWGFTWIKGFSWRRILTSAQNLSPEQTFDYLMRLIESNERPGGDAAVVAGFERLRVRYYQSPRDLDWVNDVSAALGGLHTALAHAGETKLEALATVWRTDFGPVTGTGSGPEVNRGVYLGQNLADIKEPALRSPILTRMAAEEFVALIYLSYIRMVLVQIRNRILTAACMYVLLLWALTSYPWMNRHAILLALSALLALMSAVAIFIYAQMHRDQILSRTTETEPGKLDGGFIERLLPVVGIPLLSLVASQFPEVSTFVFSWLEPSLSKMH